MIRSFIPDPDDGPGTVILGFTHHELLAVIGERRFIHTNPPTPTGQGPTSFVFSAAGQDDLAETVDLLAAELGFEIDRVIPMDPDS